ncbi:MAG: hypothetical protein ACOZJX_08075 [Pseudomonadota bacterium]
MFILLGGGEAIVIEGISKPIAMRQLAWLAEGPLPCELMAWP